MNFGTNLRNLRLQRSLTQQKLADDLNISQASITAYENGIREPNFETVRKFAEYFHVAPSALMPFGDFSEDETTQRMAEAIYKNPRLKKLFNQIKNFSDDDLDVLFVVIHAMTKERV